MSTTEIPSNSWLGSIRQQASHAHLSVDVSRSTVSATSMNGRLDAVIVPASRPSALLQPAVNLAARLGVLLVVLCSMDANVDEVAARVAKKRGTRALIVPIPAGWKHPDFPKRTSAAEFQCAKGDRVNDLSAKRNLGLLLARLRGWTKIVFLDDDVILRKRRSMARLAEQLDTHHVAGMALRHFPDNSVVCHACRVAGLWQDVFVTGAVLGVNCTSPLSFFPDIYNEDWFFFAKEAAERALPRVGCARQAKYNPFASPDRARLEEFGDLLAEGLYALFGRQGPGMPFNERLGRATSAYWRFFIEARLKVINKAHKALYEVLDQDPSNIRADSALSSLATAKSHLKNVISPDLCVHFVDAWREDLTDWQNFSQDIKKVGSIPEAMDCLQLDAWTIARFSGPQIDVEIADEPDAAMENRSATVLESAAAVVNAAADIADSKTAPPETMSRLSV